MRPRMLDSAQQELQTLRDLLRYTVTQFNASKLSFGHGNDSAWDEAVYLLLHTLHLPLDTLDPFLDARVLPEERERFLTLVERRARKSVVSGKRVSERVDLGGSGRIKKKKEGKKN